VILLEQPNFEALYHAWVYPAPIYLTAILVGGFAYRNSELVQREKLKAASAIGSYIAHELRTPLASIRSRARFSANALARETSRSLDETDVSGMRKSADLDRSVESLKVIQEEVEYANTLIDMLLLNTKDSLLPDNVGEQNNASEIVAESVRRYPFSNSRERESVFTEIIDDFAIKGERLLIVHVVFNLLKNAVLYMQRKPNGQTHIRVLVEGNRGVIEVTDTGPGIPRMIRKRIFERFFTTLESGRGTGIGLSFCKMVMEGLGGEITVDSTEGEFTTFRLLFPIEAKS
jgi:two-component system CAI-1 autoinducer sensor kinase/phosphatase CqsS